VMRKGDLVRCKSDNVIGIIVDWLDPMYPRMVTVLIGSITREYFENDLEVI